MNDDKNTIYTHAVNGFMLPFALIAALQSRKCAVYEEIKAHCGCAL